MNLIGHPELLDRLASAYALGTLRGGARRRFEALAREQAPVRAAALVWQSRLASLNELQPEVAPDPVVWQRIARRLQADREAPVSRSRPAGIADWLRSLWLWRGAAAAGALASVVALVAGLNLREQLGGQVRELQARLLASPQIAYVAVLADEQAAPAMLATYDPRQGRLTLQRVNAYREAADRSLQLWALPPSGAPRSLGVLGPDAVLRLPSAEDEVRNASALAVSLEPQGGVPSERGPTGPVLFKGALIRKAL
ncbi:anti-sigma factor [Ramlibacter sp. 2FC]|uniref:anti-sigma factor n=1 Tax=Ramlibacter sp. 2FC TaxID=2502188 RepID=UPI0010F7ECAF|nr:anti-sigma factor [Ramlibacter sp. 2FC]